MLYSFFPYSEINTLRKFGIALQDHNFLHTKRLIDRKGPLIDFCQMINSFYFTHTTFIFE